MKYILFYNINPEHEPNSLQDFLFRNHYVIENATPTRYKRTRYEPTSRNHNKMNKNILKKVMITPKITYKIPYFMRNFRLL